MSNTVELLWILLPAGVDAQGGSKHLKITAALMPRLTTDPSTAPTLGSFPDLSDWPARLAGATFHVEFGGAGTLVRNAEIVSPPADSALWRALFPPTVPVESHSFDDHSSASLVTNQITGIHQQTKQLYAAAAHAIATPDPTQRATALDNLYTSFRRKAQRGKLIPPDGPDDGPARGEPPPGGPAPEPLSPEERQLNDFARYHGLGGTSSPAAPPTPPAEPKREFHQIVSSLGNFPGLLRLLGLVIDLRVDAAGLPPTGAPSSPATLVLRPSLAGFTHATPRTAYLWDGTTFAIQPTKDPTEPAAAAIAGGFHHLDPGSFSLIDHDVDSSGFKAGQFIAGHSPGAAANADREAPPSLRTSGLTLAHDTRDEALSAAFRRSKDISEGIDPIFGADVIRGFRVDIFDGRPGARAWRSLCQRSGTYTFTNAPHLPLEIEDEGFVQIGVTHADVDDGVATYKLSEGVFRWEGWSLSAPHPMTALSRDPDPAKAIPSGPVDVPDRFGLKTAFKAKPKTLPTLRFGFPYRTRLRLVNLAGDSVALDSGDESAALPDALHPFVYRRHEPLLAPLVALKTPLRTPPAGETIDRLVILSFNANQSDDATPSAERAVRHVLPPRISQLLAERHGLFDDASGRLKTDPVTHALIAARDSGQLEHDPAKAAPIDSADQATIPYWADPLCRGASFRGAPHLAKGTRQRAAGGSLIPKPFDPGLPNPTALEPIVQIPFLPEAPLPSALLPTDPAAFCIILAEGAGPPLWSAAERSLTFFLNKGEVSTLDMGSFLEDVDLDLLGIWQWILEHSQDNIPIVKEKVIDGGHPLVTPPRAVALIHAVQQPIGVPSFSTGITPLPRKLGETFADLAADLTIDGRATGKVTIRAVWMEEQHPPRRGATKTEAFAAHVVDVTLAHDDNEPSVIGVESAGRFVDGRLSFVDTPDTRPLRHHFGDGKHRKVKYRALAASRFEPYFPTASPGGFTREGPEIEVSIPNSLPPDAPTLLYVVPSFGWTSQTVGKVTTRTRMGGVRVFMSGTWLSSGDGELLAVLLDEGASPPLPLATRWALDPFWSNQSLEASKESGLASRSSFPTAVIGSMTPAVVAAYEVDFDDDTQRMFVDIPITPPGSSYFPFLRLALARYQPNASDDKMRLSTPVLSDLVQIPPLRTATIDVSNPGQINVTVTGRREPDARSPVPGAGSAGPQIVVDIETRPLGSTSELEWEKKQRVDPATMDLWQGHFTPLPGMSNRVLIREIETYPSGHKPIPIPVGKTIEEGGTITDDGAEPKPLPESGEPLTERVTYADVFELPSG
jgi:hypothetical protein